MSVIGLLAIVLMMNIVDAFWILPQNTSEPRHFVLSPMLKYLSPPDPPFPITGRMVYTNQEVPPFPLNGLILLYETKRLQFNSVVAKRFKDSGLQALVVQMLSEVHSPGFGELVVDAPVKRENPFPVFEITVAQSRELTGWFQNQTERGLIVLFEGPEHNPWAYYISTVYPAGAYVLLITAGIVLIAAVYKLTLIICSTGPQLSIGQAVLGLVIIAMTIRVVWCMVDPFGVYQLAHLAWNQIGMTLPLAIILGSTLLIALYWHEMIKLTGKTVFIFLDKLMIPFFIFAVALIVFEFVTSILRGLRHFSSGLAVATSSIYAILTVAILIIFLVEKIRISIVFSKINSRLHSKRKKRLDQAFFLVLGISVIMIIWLVPIILIAATDWSSIPVGRTIIWFIILFGINIVAFFQVMLIRAPYRPWKWIFCGICMKRSANILPITSSDSSKLDSNYNSTKSFDVGSSDLATSVDPSVK
jgi:hypothetical protein